MFFHVRFLNTGSEYGDCIMYKILHANLTEAAVDDNNLNKLPSIQTKYWILQPHFQPGN